MNTNGGQYWASAKSSGERRKRCAKDLQEIEQAGPRSQVCRDESPAEELKFQVSLGSQGKNTNKQTNKKPKKKKKCWGSGGMCIFLSVI